MKNKINFLILLILIYSEFFGNTRLNSKLFNGKMHKKAFKGKALKF